MSTSPWQTPVKYGIINAHNTDGFAMIAVYADGSEKHIDGYYFTVEAAEASVEGSDIPVEDWTDEDE